MVKRKYLLFVEAFLVALFIFTFGILAGIFVENARANQVGQNFAKLESDILDAKLFSDLITESECDLAVKKNIEFADMVFFEAKLLEKYDEVSEVSDSIREQHKKYDLLRAVIWVNSIKIKERCNASFHNLVYLYDYENPGIEKRAMQGVISNILRDIKESKGDEVLLVSIAGDIDSPSVELLREKYNITTLPSVVIDEKTVLTDIHGREDIEKYL